MVALIVFVVVTALPVVIAPLLLLDRGSRLLPFVPWVPLTALVLPLYRGETVELPWLLLGARLGIDAVALPLVLLAAVVWTLAGWHARWTLPRAEQSRFFSFWLATWCGNLCVFVTLDAASFYAAYALMTVAAYGLVIHSGRPADFRAGRVYITMAFLGEALLVAGLLLLGAEAGNVALEEGPDRVAAHGNAGVVAVLMLAGFGVKMGMLGLHMWLPLAHPQAPVPASAVLSGVILKAGLIGWLRFLPVGEPGFETLGSAMLVIGLATAFFGVGIGLTQPRMKSLLAYSSVSQMGLVTALVALALLNPGEAGVFVALATLFALHHGLAKATLFVGVDLVRQSPRLARWLLWVPAASLAGLPLTSGALVKTAWKSALPWAGLEFWLLMSSVATTLLMARLLWLAWPSATAYFAAERRAGRVGWRPAAPWLALAGASLLLPWALAATIHPAWAAQAWQFGYVRDTAMPVLAGVVLALIAARSWRGRSVPQIPEGDVLALLPSTPARPRFAPRRRHRIAWQPPLAQVEARLAALAPALLLGALVLSAAAILSVMF